MLVVPPQTTLASGRGRNGSPGARLFSQTFTGCPLLDVNANGVRITGLRNVTDNATGVRRGPDGFASSSTSFRPGP
jgi:hypothetical protein